MKKGLLSWEECERKCEKSVKRQCIRNDFRDFCHHDHFKL